MTRTELEAVLADTYRAEADCYARAVALLDQADADPQLSHLAAILAEVAALEGQIAPSKAAWQKLAQPPGPPLRQAVDELAELLRTLNARVEALATEVEQRKRALAPQVHEVVRFQQMQQAYGRHTAFQARG
jgi:outer membrane murein-binding lipoprotein Lpp